MKIRTLFWGLGDWIASLPCKHGFHEFSEWSENTYRARLIFSWFRECERCQEIDWLFIGNNPPEVVRGPSTVEVEKGERRHGSG